MLDPLVMQAFSRELEKEAVFTPSSALRAMKSKNRFMRGLGRFGAETQGIAARAAPGINETVANYPEPSFMVGALKGEILRAGAERAARSPKAGKLKKFLNRGGDWGTFIERQVPEVTGLTDLVQQGATSLV